MIDNEVVDAVLRRFRSSRVMTISELAAGLSCSQRSAQRYLGRWGSIRSYNHNGRYFTLPEIPEFDQFGIWRYTGIGFSRHGNLRETVIHLIESSTGGMTAAELGQVMDVNPHSFMSQFRRDSRLQRDKCGGRLVYFCARSEVCDAQRRVRLASEARGPSRLPSETQAVTILVCLVKNQDATIAELEREVAKHHRGIDRQMIERLLEHHGLTKKKPQAGCTSGP